MVQWLRSSLRREKGLLKFLKLVYFIHSSLLAVSRVRGWLEEESRTSGCAVGASLTAVGGGGAGFYAVIRYAWGYPFIPQQHDSLSIAYMGWRFCCLHRVVDAFGTITSFDITNHGVGYTSKPSIVTSDSNCLCGGQPGSLPGVFEQCFELKVGL
jgi:hypothetical protein